MANDSKLLVLLFLLSSSSLVNGFPPAVASHRVGVTLKKRNFARKPKVSYKPDTSTNSNCDGGLSSFRRRRARVNGPLHVLTANSYYDNGQQSFSPEPEPASTTAQQEQVLEEYRVPKVRDVLAFAVPAVGVWLCVPLLSMITTSCVGLLSGTAQQAALNPAVAVINYSARAMCFLFSGTTTMMAAAKDRDSRDSSTSIEKPRTARTLVGALQISILVGTALGVSVLVFSRQLLGVIIGGGSSTMEPNIMGAAMKFVKIRALGFPAAAMLGSAQTACLAQGDIRMPLIATVLCALTNLGLDLVLIRNPHAWIGGAAGAAIATTLAQYIAAGWAIRWLTTTRQRPAKTENQRHSPNGAARSSTRGFLAGRMSLADLVKRPSKEISKGFAPYVIPVFSTQMGRSSASAAIDHVVSSSLSTASMAANQILTSVYYSLVPVAEGLSMAAQNFVPGIVEREGSRPEEKAFAMRRLLFSFLKAAGLCGLFLAAIMGSLPFYCGAFTSDAAVQSLVTAVVPLLFLTCLKHGVFCGCEGLLLGQKDLRFLGTQYGIYTFLIPYILLQVKKAAVGGSTRVSLVTVWQIFLGYDIFRTVLMMGRILWLERKRSNGKESLPTRVTY